MKQPNCAATSPMTAVHTPIMAIEQKKQIYPLKRPVVFDPAKTIELKKKEIYQKKY
jgi:hypothetical protein